MAQEEAFPRGGGRPLSGTAKKRLREEGEAAAVRDFQAEQLDSAKRGRKAKKTADGDEFEVFEGSSAAQKAKLVAPLRFKNIAVGARVLGVVSEIGPQELTISLPHGLRGFVDANEAFDAQVDRKVSRPPLARLFHVGQYVRCLIIDLQEGRKEQRRRVILSLRLSRLVEGLTSSALVQGVALPACVTSLEDHGYLLSFGIQGTAGFLAYADEEASSSGEGVPHKLVVGQVLDCLVTACADKRLVHVTADPSRVAAALSPDWGDASIGGLLPGMMVQARVRACATGGMLVSFLMFFQGAVDQFHLHQDSAAPGWEEVYPRNKAFRARIIYVDPASKAVRLSFRPHVVAWAPAALPPIGSLMKAAQVKAVDNVVGAQLSLPASADSEGPGQCPGFCHVSELADQRVQHPSKYLHPGQEVTVRVIGARPVEGAAVVSLKPSVVEGDRTRLGQLAVGALVSGHVSRVEDFGVFVDLSRSLKALVPAAHLEKGSRQPKKGDKVVGRVLELLPSQGRVRITLKRALVSSKLAVLSSLQDAELGMRAHGVVTGIHDYGVFVGFYNDCSGLAPVEELAVEPSQRPSDVYTVGQVTRNGMGRHEMWGFTTGALMLNDFEKAVKARVISATGADKLRVSLRPAKAGVPAEEHEGGTPTVQPGAAVEARVSSVQYEAKDPSQPGRYLVECSVPGHKDLTVPAQIEVPHLADHPAAAEALRSCLQAGSPLGRVIVLQDRSRQGGLTVSRKASLIAAAKMLPSELGQVAEGALVPGYVASITEDSVFVRFLKDLTGRAGLNQLADSFVSSPRAHYTVGQSVCAMVQGIDSERQRLALSLKPSLTSRRDGAYSISLFADLEAAERIRAAQEADKDAVVDWSQLAPGTLAAGSVHDVQEYGIVCDLEAHPDLVGLLNTQQAKGAKPAAGSPIQAGVLDVNKKDGIVDLCHESLLKQLSKPPPMKLGQHVSGVVELVKEHYMVLTLKGTSKALAYALTHDFNFRDPESHTRFHVGQGVSGTVVALPSGKTGGRLLVQVTLMPKVKGASSRPAGDHKAGTRVTGRVTVMEPTYMDLELDAPRGAKGRVHASEVADTPPEQPFAAMKVGQRIEAVILPDQTHKVFPRSSARLSLSMRPSLVKAGAVKGPVGLQIEQLEPGQPVQGYVERVVKDYAWVDLAPGLQARLHALDACSDLPSLRRFQGDLTPGQLVKATVLQAADGKVDLGTVTKSYRAGEALPARITDVSGTGVRLQLSAHILAQVALTDIHSSWVENALTGLTAGSLVLCRLLEDHEGKRGKHAAAAIHTLPKSGKKQKAVKAAEHPGLTSTADLSEGQQVQGYVRAVGAQGVFVTLGRGVDARIRLSNLSDTFVEDPAAAFVPGQLVQGTVLSLDPARVEMSIRQKAKPSPTWQALPDFIHEGATVQGRVKRVEKFGAFVALSAAELTGLVHLSELSDDFVKDPAQHLQVGQAVKAKVLAVDAGKQRLSLGMKESYFVAEDEQEPGAAAVAPDLDAQLLQQMQSRNRPDDNAGPDGLAAEGAAAGRGDAGGNSPAEPAAANKPKQRKKRKARADAEAAEAAAEAAAEPAAAQPSRAPEKLPAASAQGVGWGDEVQPGLPAAVPDDVEAPPSKRSRRQAKRAAEAQEEATHAAELARLAGEGPRDAAFYEREVVSTPSSSLVWVQYMAHHLAQGELAAARETAERALRTISFREEAEKRNVWVAWLNLEARHGEPPQEAVMALFRRALPYTDAKRLYLALLSILEASQLAELQADVLKVMTKKFSASAKVWLAAVQGYVRQKNVAAAQGWLERATKALPQRKHVQVLSQTAVAYYRSELSEQGRNILDSVLRSYPKRLDLWNLYMDQELKWGSASQVRGLFERSTSSDLPPRKMKSIFKQWLDYEMEHGTSEKAKAVQDAARTYVEQHMDG